MIIMIMVVIGMMLVITSLHDDHDNGDDRDGAGNNIMT